MHAKVLPATQDHRLLAALPVCSPAQEISRYRQFLTSRGGMSFVTHRRLHAQGKHEKELSRRRKAAKARDCISPPDFLRTAPWRLGALAREFRGPSLDSQMSALRRQAPSMDHASLTSCRAATPRHIVTHSQMPPNLTSPNTTLEVPPPAKSPCYAPVVSAGHNSRRLCPEAPPMRAKVLPTTQHHLRLAALPACSPTQRISPYGQFPPYALPNPPAFTRTRPVRSAA